MHFFYSIGDSGDMKLTLRLKPHMQEPLENQNIQYYSGRFNLQYLVWSVSDELMLDNKTIKELLKRVQNNFMGNSCTSFLVGEEVIMILPVLHT